MISRVDLRGRPLDAMTLRACLPRVEHAAADALEAVVPICEDVRLRGAQALRDLGERFDGVRPERLRVPAEILAAALADLDPAVRAALEESARRARLVHRDQLPAQRSTTLGPGAVVHQRWIPVDRVGLYVPGGLALYPSSVVMNVVPAQVAGVGSLAVTSPPQRDNRGVYAGYPDPTILAACALLGVDEVYAVGGAQAIAMFAHGAAEADGREVCAPVAVVTGPGNIFVATAKRHLSGIIGIDAEAGPTEIMVIADADADPDLIACDLISQAEHDPNAASVLVTDSVELAAAVQTALARRVAATKHQERVLTALSGRQSAIVLVDDPAAAVAVANAYGAEHLEIHTADAAGVAASITNAGAVFVGPNSPVPLGDYCAGSNHVLPTSGTSAHSSGLGVHSFLRSVQVIEYDARGLAQVAPAIRTLAAAEDLPAHADAVDARLAIVGDALDDGVGDAPGSPNSPEEVIDDLLRLDLRGRTAYGAPQLDVPVALNTNENSYPVPPVVVEAMAAAITAAAPEFNRYPDREFTLLRADLARYTEASTGVRLDPAQIWAGNGSNEVILHVVQAFGGPDRTALGFTPSYAMYPNYALTTGTRWVDGARGIGPDGGAYDGPRRFEIDPTVAAAQVRAVRPDIVFLASPNNPTGTALDPAVIEAVYDAAERAVVVVDEAYGEFARAGTTSAMALLAGRPRLAVTRTMSKAFALAGGRLGYLAADPALLDALRVVRMPYHLSTPSQVIARAALAHAGVLQAEVDAIRAQRDRLVVELAALGLDPVPSDANFVLFGGLADSAATWRALLDAGVLVRDVALPGYLRVTAGTEPETSAFLHALADHLQDTRQGARR